MPALRARLQRRRLSDEDGFTLVEQLVTVVLLGIGVVAVLGAVLTLISTSARHRDMSNATAVLANAAARVASADTTWKPCGVAADYSTAAKGPVDDLPQGMSLDNVTVTSVAYWDGQAFATTCPTGGICNTGLTCPTNGNVLTTQLVTISVTTGNVTNQTIQVVKWDGGNA